MIKSKINNLFKYIKKIDISDLYIFLNYKFYKQNKYKI